MCGLGVGGKEVRNFTINATSSADVKSYRK